MADISRGPVSSMPGSVHHLPEGATCDEHPLRRALKRVQGETDSFGCEYVDMCEECFNAFRTYEAEERKRLKYCCWCKQEKMGVRPHRDMDEGMSGPLYDVCGDCITAENMRAAEELEESGYFDRYYADSFDEDC
jgi:hypothetical protein